MVAVVRIVVSIRQTTAVTRVAGLMDVEAVQRVLVVGVEAAQLDVDRHVTVHELVECDHSHHGLGAASAVLLDATDSHASTVIVVMHAAVVIASDETCTD